MQIYTKFSNFTGLCFPHFTTIRNQTLQFGHFKMLFPAMVMAFLDTSILYAFNNKQTKLVNLPHQDFYLPCS